MNRGPKLVRAISVVSAVLLLGACGLALICGGLVIFVEVPVTLAFGWAKHLWRVVPNLNPDPWAAGTAVVGLAGVTVGAHYFLRWLAGSEWPLQRSLQCVSLVVLIFVAGIAMVGMTHQTAWLARSPEPLVTNTGQEFLARTTSANHLKQLGLATENHANANAQLPRSRFDAAGRPLHSWQTDLLPYIEEDALHKQIDLTKPWTHPANAEPLSARIPIFQSYAFGDGRVNGFGVSHYAGNPVVVMGEPKALNAFPQGTANAILAGEVNAGFRAWGDPLNARDPRQGVAGGPHAFGGPKRAPQFVMLDGSVRTFDAKELAELVGKVPE